MGFIRKKENFTCINCGAFIVGDGYTNHCPNCLYSEHVDVTPGDRKNTCRGLMEPIGVEIKDGERIIVHRCTKCGEIKRCKSSPRDNFEAVLQVIQKQISY
ncbi:MAG TPA: RNHCP domain-containing protein [bacterium]|jgi:predicted RNA-binding Zn-ribbon protein involved in translation (DUF1610 family)|nr:RNHCP domain-containing protein [bacterium]